jgi:hypothetical protein
MSILKDKKIYVITLIAFIIIFETTYQSLFVEENKLSKEFVEYVEKNKN